MNDDLATYLDTISSLKQGARKRSILLSYCKKNNIPEWKMWKKIAESAQYDTWYEMLYEGEILQVLSEMKKSLVVFIKVVFTNLLYTF